MQNYRSKSETAIIIAGCLNFRRFQFFSLFQFPHFGLLICFAVSSGFFAVSLGFFAVSKPANTCKMTNMQKLFGGRKKCRQPPAIIPEKAIILHTLEDAGIHHTMCIIHVLCIYIYMYIYICIYIYIYHIYIYIYIYIYSLFTKFCFQWPDDPMTCSENRKLSTPDLDDRSNLRTRLLAGWFQELNLHVG